MGAWLSLNGALLIAAYLLGSIPTGYAVGKWMLGIDIRRRLVRVRRVRRTY
jgi:glycerol-3-phosphate acyltransferase PlsY